MTNRESAASGPHSSHSAASTGSRETVGLARDIGEVRGEVRVLKWVCGLALVAILSGMGVLYQHQQSLASGLREVRGDIERIDERTIHLADRLGRLEDQAERLEGRMDRLHVRFGEVEQLLRVLVARNPADP